MEGIFKYLSRYKNLTPPHASTVKLLIDIIKSDYGILLEESSIKFQRGGIILSCHPTIRSEISRYAPEVINTLYKKHNVRLSFIR
jgi:hypothetical protein